ncbi:hypothetical protein CANCADRAFT_2579 [Tortispora caseinolytica NRRL Y-17796]|uniref:SAM-dependent MTase RsmB/NOP-type domain-containing protein n=1 Tax=Tortispora caseinolytica NRRL Y-17796 TaxID=767744 RepID=A0A1E4TGH8_9ASCO|nr:hypothetical protein CANCADRAFT_2579 [Tortispora caseinolytica NRRL Y-17796]
MSLYVEAARVLKEPGVSLKQKVYNRKKPLRSSPGRLYALLAGYMDHEEQVKAIVKEVGSFNIKGDKDAAVLVVYDLLFNRKGISASKNHPPPFIKEILKLETRLRNIYDKVVGENANTEADLSPVRWFRLNSLKVQDDQVLKWFPSLELVEQFPGPKQIMKDKYVDGLYGVSPEYGSTLKKNKHYIEGEIILQDRASCFPAELLNPKSGWCVVDACAAPGNKTTHVASKLIHTGGSVIAFEKDPQRARILQNNLKLHGADQLVETRVQDFLAQTEDRNVKGLIVDPSCSGSGIYGRGNKAELDPERLIRLAAFQSKILKHALTTFPEAECVVYSTCSYHDVENEGVVCEVLQDEEIAQNWMLASRDEALPEWPRRGNRELFEEFNMDPSLAESLIRVERGTDGGIGFFAAKFVRKHYNTEPEWQGFSD